MALVYLFRFSEWKPCPVNVLPWAQDIPNSKNFNCAARPPHLYCTPNGDILLLLYCSRCAHCTLLLRHIYRERCGRYQHTHRTPHTQDSVERATRIRQHRFESCWFIAKQQNNSVQVPNPQAGALLNLTLKRSRKGYTLQHHLGSI